MSAQYVVQTVENLDWSPINRITNFHSPWSLNPIPPMVFRGVIYKHYFHFLFEVYDNDILVYQEKDDPADVLHSDRVELFFARDAAMNEYYCLEMDALGRLLDYSASYYRQFDYNWTWPENGLALSAGLNDSGYWVKGKLSLDSLKQLKLIHDNAMFCGIYRGKCLQKRLNPSFEWISWNIPASHQPDFHIPSSLGKLVL